MSLSSPVRLDKSHVTITKLFENLFKSLPAGTSLQQRIALVSILDSVYTPRALVDGLIAEQVVSQVSAPNCTALIATRTLMIPLTPYHANQKTCSKQDAPVSCLTRPLQVAAALHCSATDAGIPSLPQSALQL